MADRKVITLNPGGATPQNIVMRALPAADAATTTDLLLRALHATPQTIIIQGFTATSNPQAVTVVPGAMRFVGKVATVVASDHKSVTVVPGAMRFLGKTATVVASDHKAVAVVAGGMRFLGAIPTVVASDHQAVAVAPGAMRFVGAVATVVATATPQTSTGGGGGGRIRTERGSARIRKRQIEEAVDRAVAIIAARNAPPQPVAVVASQVEPIARQEVPAISAAEIRQIVEAVMADLARLRAAEEQDDEEAFIMALAA